MVKLVNTSSNRNVITIFQLYIQWTFEVFGILFEDNGNISHQYVLYFNIIAQIVNNIINLFAMQDWQNIMIEVIGWIYFFAWSFSFYGQIYENCKNKSVQGMNFDFVGMNMTGFLFYSLYCTWGYFVNSEQTGRVDLNDLLFSYHALFATLVTLGTACYFPYKKNKIHGITILYLIAMWTFLIVYTILTEATSTVTVNNKEAGVITIMGYFKLSISFLKYLPQFYWNYKRKSTKGWSIFNILLDLTGGLFSFLQMGLEAIFGQNVEINIVKLVLGIMVVCYDILFVIQHYCLYPQKSRSDLIESNQYKESDLVKRNQQINQSIKSDQAEKEESRQVQEPSSSEISKPLITQE